MHNVRVDQIERTAEDARRDASVAKVQINLQGEWRAGDSMAQFGGPVEFPQGELILQADFPPFLGGEGRAPSPLAYCFYGAMSCYGSTFATQAAMAGVHVDEMRIRLTLGVDFRTALGLGEFPPLSEFRFDVEVKTDASEEDVARVKTLTDERCPAIWAMQNPVSFSTTARKIAG
jgi:uncharacterized OsmC-like protein